MTVAHRLQIRQYNDPEILGFLTSHAVTFRLVGDHLFIIDGHEGELAAGPGDWLTVAPSGDVDVERGDYAQRARRALTRAKKARAQRDDDQRGGLPRSHRRQPATRSSAF